MQWINFKLDEEGIKLKSEARIVKYKNGHKNISIYNIFSFYKNIIKPFK